MNSFFLLFTICVLVLPTESHAESPPRFQNESEAGVVVTTGNSETTTLSVKSKSSYPIQSHLLRGQASFLRSSSQGEEQAYQWGVGLRDELTLTPNLSGFLGQAIESNRYQGILQRHSTDLGGRRSLEKSEALLWFFEVGYRFNRENDTSGGFRNFSFLRIYHEIERIFSPNVRIKWWVEGLPNLSDSNAYQVNSEAALIATLTEIFSMKTSYLFRYNHEPPAGARFLTDTLFTTALVAKF